MDAQTLQIYAPSASPASGFFSYVLYLRLKATGVLFGGQDPPGTSPRDVASHPPAAAPAPISPAPKLRGSQKAAVPVIAIQAVA